MKLRASLFLIALTTAALAAEPANALKAAKAIPKTLTKSFAGLTARGGAPAPEKWLVLIHDAKTASGVREFTIASGVVVSSKEGSDFVQKLESENRIDLTKIRVDSDLAAELTAAYAAVNNSVPASFDFDLRQAGTEAAPLWSVVALDETGAKLGTVVVAANTGAVISHDGFATQPTPPDLTDEVSASKTSTASNGTVKKTSSSSSSSSRESTARRIGGHLKKFFTGRR